MKRVRIKWHRFCIGFKICGSMSRLLHLEMVRINNARNRTLRMLNWKEYAKRAYRRYC